MPRPKATVPSYQHHKPSGQAFMRVTLPGGERKTVYLGKHNSPESRAEYARRVRLLGTASEAVAPAQLATGPSDLTVAELLVGFLEHADRHYRGPDGKPTSSVWAFKLAAKPLRELFAYLPAAEFGPTALKTLRGRMVELGWSRKTVNAAVTSVRTVFKWGVSEELVPAELLARLASVAGLQRGRSAAHDPDPVGPVPDSDVSAILPFVPRGVRGLIQFQRFTGARPGEAVLLRRCDLDASADTWTYTPPAHKNAWRGKGRTIAVGPRGRQLLGEFATTDPAAPVFPTAEGTAYTVSGYRQAVERGCLKAKVPVWSPNQLRHTFATEARRLFGLEGAQVALGHSKADTTQIYAERDNALSAKVVAQIG